MCGIVSIECEGPDANKPFPVPQKAVITFLYYGGMSGAGHAVSCPAAEMQYVVDKNGKPIMDERTVVCSMTGKRCFRVYPLR